MSLHRRTLLNAGLAGVGLAGLGGCASLPASLAAPGPAMARPRLAPLRAQANRLFDLTVCIRPFRAAGPRIESEQIRQPQHLSRCPAAGTDPDARDRPLLRDRSGERGGHAFQHEGERPEFLQRARLGVQPLRLGWRAAL